MHISKVLYAGCSVCVLWVDGEVESDLLYASLLLYSQCTHFTKSTLDHNGSGVGWRRTNSGKGKVTVKYAVFFTIPKIWRYGLKFCYFITTVCNTNPAFMSCVSENQCCIEIETMRWWFKGYPTQTTYANKILLLLSNIYALFTLRIKS